MKRIVIFILVFLSFRFYGQEKNTLYSILLECIEESKRKYENSIAWTQLGHKMYLNPDGLPDPNARYNKSFYDNLPLSTVSWGNTKKYGKVFDVLEVYFSLQNDIIEVRIALATVTREGKKHYSHAIWFEDVDVYTYRYSCSNQQWERIPECIYSDVNTQSFVCIQNDSISIFLKEPLSDNASYFYGTYQRSNDTLYLSDNLLRSANAIVDTVYTDYPGTEIQLYELYVVSCLGCKEAKYQDSLYYELTTCSDLCWDYDKSFPGLWYEPNLKANDEGLIQIPAGTLNNHENNGSDLLIRGMYFYTKQRLYLKPHVRYVIKQKTKKGEPLELNEYYLVIDDEHKTITISPQPWRITVTNGVKSPNPIVLERRQKKTFCYRELKRWWLWLFGIE